MKKLINLILFFSLTLSIQAIGTSKTLEIKGIKLGDKLENVDLKSYDCNKDQEKNDTLFCIGQPSVTLANQKVTIIIGFTGEIVEHIYIKFHHDSYEEIKKAFILKFGKPDFEEAEILENRMGAKFPSITSIWFNKDENITINERYGEVDKATIFFISKKTVDQHTKERNVNTLKSVDDL